MDIPAIKFNSNDMELIKKIFHVYLDRGFILKRAYKKRKYIILGPYKYYVEMEIDTIGYQILITEAIDKEDYLKASELKKEFEEFKTLKF